MSEAGLSLIQVPTAHWDVARRSGEGAEQSRLGQRQAGQTLFLGALCSLVVTIWIEMAVQPHGV